jgi:hypothetical protein
MALADGNVLRRSVPGEMGEESGPFPGVKRPERDVDHPPLSSAEVEGRVELYICSPSGPSRPVYGELFFYLLYFLFVPLAQL